MRATLSPEECCSFHNREVDHYSEAQVQDGPSKDTPATAGSSVDEKHPDVKVEKAELDPWSSEPIAFTSDNGYSKKRDASFNTAAWNKADHSLYNATNTTTALPPATFHPVVINKML
ncbi:hypothetical protein PISMIDRAFT_12021 [Pisolithus microcarpus 441]|uniref:Uncharacterized protein n=1 Tax=Pisolithus microcarpus 441 TaxID=765257 RepID=A0A0C9ZHB5_9AGAM|nr:hypothetical protein PISMIDRAFT_12021 [Pisolithus microcarpus 441]